MVQTSKKRKVTIKKEALRYLKETKKDIVSEMDLEAEENKDMGLIDEHDPLRWAHKQKL